MPEPNWKALKPYGDTTDDGAVQMAFTLPVPPSAKAKEAASLLVQNWGFDKVRVAHMSEAGEGYAFFVVFAVTEKGVDYTKVEVPELETERLSYKEIDKRILRDIRRPIRVVGACTGYDAHTVGLDAILNMKGFDGDVGLERYKGFEVTNLGSQVLPDQLIEAAVNERADAILVSKIVTQKDIHVHDLRDIMGLLEKRGLSDRFVLAAGGPRITHKMALELGYDAGFGIGTMPSDVAYFLYQQVLDKKKKSGK